jgi:hypothetical protein
MMKRVVTKSITISLGILLNDFLTLGASSLDLLLSSEVDLNGILEEHASQETDIVLHDVGVNRTLSCKVYVAPSTIPGAGLGVFAGEDFEEGDIVTTADNVVPIVDLAWNNGVASFSNDFLWGKDRCKNQIACNLCVRNVVDFLLTERILDWFTRRI